MSENHYYESNEDPSPTGGFTAFLVVLAVVCLTAVAYWLGGQA